MLNKKLFLALVLLCLLAVLPSAALAAVGAVTIVARRKREQ